MFSNDSEVNPMKRCVHALLTGALVLGAAAAPAHGAASFYRATPSGSHVLFVSDRQLVPEDGDATADVYQRSAGQTKLISGGSANLEPTPRAISEDGSRAFFTTAESLVADDTDANVDVYMREGDTLKRMSGGQTGGNGPFTVAFRGISADGSQVFFQTAEKLAADDTDGSADIYSMSAGGGLTGWTLSGNGAHDVIFNAVSAPGDRLIFTTHEPLVAGDADQQSDVYAIDANGLSRVSVGSIGGNGDHVSAFEHANASATRVTFETTESLSGSDGDAARDLYQRTPVGTLLVTPDTDTHADWAGSSHDGLRVFVETTSQLTITDTDQQQDVYVRNSGASWSLISTSTSGGNDVFPANFLGANEDGLRAVFVTQEPMASSDTDAVNDLYLRAGNSTTHVSDGTGADANTIPILRAVTSGAVVFTTAEALIATDTDSANDVYLYSPGQMRTLSGGADPAAWGGISIDGAKVWYRTASQLAAEDVDGEQDVYQYTGAGTTLISAEQHPPVTTIDSAPATLAPGESATLAFSSSEAGSTFECRLDDGAFEACSSPHATGALAAGQHEFTVRASDIAGNQDPDGATATISVVAPAAEDPAGQSGASTPAGETAETGTAASDGVAPAISRLRRTRTALRYSVSESARVTFTVKRRVKSGGRTKWVRVKSFSQSAKTGTNSRRFRADGLKRGTYRVIVRARDAAGNRSAKRTLRFTRR